MLDTFRVMVVLHIGGVTVTEVLCALLCVETVALALLVVAYEYVEYVVIHGTETEWLDEDDEDDEAE